MNGRSPSTYGDAASLSWRARLQLFAVAAGAATVAALAADALTGARRRNTRIELEIGIRDALPSPQAAQPAEASPRLERTANGTPLPGPAAAAAPGPAVPVPARAAPVPATAGPAVSRHPRPATTSLVLRRSGAVAQNGRSADAALAYGWPATRKEDGWAVDAARPTESVQLQAAPATATPVGPPPEPEKRPQLPPPQPPPTPPAASGAGDRGRGLKTTKRVLVLALLAGIAVYVGGGGAFGSFSAETTNTGSTASSGTLTMSDQVNSSTACTSISGAKNVKSNCGAILTLANLAPGVFPSTGATATVTVQNTGSIDASKLWLWAPPNSTTLSAALGSSAVSSLPVAALKSAVGGGQSIVVSSGGNSQTFVATGATGTTAAAAGATSIPVTSQTPNATYGSGSAVNVVDCADTQTTTSTVTGATVGTGLNGFNPTTGNPFCGTVLLYVQEITGTTPGTTVGTHNYCWVGANYGTTTLGTTTGSLTAGTLSSASIGISSSAGTAPSGGTVTITDGTNSDILTLGSAVSSGATSITASGTLNHSYSTGASVKYSNGMCKAPIDVTLSSPLSTTNTNITTLSVNALNGNVANGDSIVVTSSSGSNTQTFTAAADAYIGATTITISPATPNYNYTTSATVTDSTTTGSLNSDTTDTLTDFDTLHNGAQGPIELKTVAGNGALAPMSVVDELPTGTSAARKFQIGVYFPQPAGTNQNALQGLASTFGMTWHIDQ